MTNDKNLPKGWKLDIETSQEVDPTDSSRTVIVTKGTLYRRKRIFFRTVWVREAIIEISHTRDAAFKLNNLLTETAHIRDGAKA